MNLLDYFRSSRKNTAAIAKERLQIVIAHERAERRAPDFLPRLKEELLAVVRKYVQVEPDAVSINMERDADREVLELNIVLAEDDTKRET